MRRHNTVVAELANQVKDFFEKDIPFRVYHGSTNSNRPICFDRNLIVDISELCRIVSIDKHTCTAVVEPKVSMADLVKETLKHGLVPAVIPEFPGITVGGAFAGTAAESSSFRFGYFDQSLNWIEVILGNGEIVRASPTENSELFYASGGAMGTMGIATLFEVQLVPCSRYVRVEYHPISSAEEAVNQMDALMTIDIDYRDGLLFSESVGMLITATITSKPDISDTPVVQFTRPKDRWFFTHVHGKSRCNEKVRKYCITCYWTKRSMAYKQQDTVMAELVPLYDYLFRYDRGSFWMGAYGWAPNLWNRLTRGLLNPIFKTEFGYRVLQLAGTSQTCIIQDLAIPRDRCVEFVQFLEERLKIYPLWLCPIKDSPRGIMRRPKGTANQAFPRDSIQGPSPCPSYSIDIGVWGVPNHGNDPYSRDTVDKFVGDNRAIERKLAETHGLKWLYAQKFYTEEEFWTVYDRAEYDKLRERWKANRLPSVFDKVKREPKAWQDIQFWRAIVLAALKREHLIKRPSL